jgi:hypothetical protein
MCIKAIGANLNRAARLCGTAMDPEMLADCSELVLDRFKFRTVNALRLAIRDGLNSGKIYGKLTYPILAEWLTNHEEAVEAHNYRKHQQTK